MRFHPVKSPKVLILTPLVLVLLFAMDSGSILRSKCPQICVRYFLPAAHQPQHRLRHAGRAFTA